MPSPIMLSAHAVFVAAPAFDEPTGQGWTQIGLFAIAVALSFVIGIEREVKQKAAGIRTYTLVGAGSALFMLVSKYGFTDVLGPHVTLDPSRVAAQVVTGLGFIGGGLIFVRRDAVRGLTTAASMWLTAAIGATAAAGLPVLACVATATYFIVLYLLRPLAYRIGTWSPEQIGMRITYLDGRGLLREIITDCGVAGFALYQLTTEASDPLAPEDVEPSVESGHQEPDTVPAAARTVEVLLVLRGRGNLDALSNTLSEKPGVLSIVAPASTAEE